MFLFVRICFFFCLDLFFLELLFNFDESSTCFVDGCVCWLPLPAGPLCSERCSVGILASTQSSSCLPSIQLVRYSMSRQFPEGKLFNRCSGHTPWAGRGGRISAEFFGALEANAAF